ncbi:MAG: carboxypeptidase regulatory-like domain-containing protein, partial [bacterium]|nr:carboxypeptidase regulatory-like domain-containing protein [bacterium]
MKTNGLRRAKAVLFCVLLTSVGGHGQTAEAEAAWVSATDSARVVRSGSWRVTRFRYAAADHLQTNEPGAALEFRFQGSGLVLRNGANAVPAYGVPNLGKLSITIDGQDARVIRPRDTADEVTIARGLGDRGHKVRIEHQPDNGSTGVRIEGFRVLSRPTGDLQFTVTGEENAYLVDVRAIVTRGAQQIRNSLVRNWLTGQCRLAGLTPGTDYTLEIRATGWKPRRIPNITIKAGGETQLPPIYLHREDATRTVRFRFPALGRPAIRHPGESFRARFLGRDTTIEQVRLQRSAGPATISRTLDFEEDTSAAFYYDREVTAALPDDMPEGLYDLTVKLSGSEWAGTCRSPWSVYVVKAYPENPIFLTFGHLDTSGQYQAEYLERLATIANLLSPDMVLVSNAVNPAYISGALSDLKMPYVINFGNHQFPGHQKWYGEPVALVDFGPDIVILNFGLPWHVDLGQAHALLSARAGARRKIVNAFEHNAPVEQFLDKHGISLIHDGHGPGKKVMDIGATPTHRVGKVNSSSFRLVRFQGNRVVSSTYDNDEIAPIPFGRDEAPPVRVTFSPATNGTHSTLTATVTNTLKETYPNANLTFILPKGNYVTDHGRIQSAIASDNGQYAVLTVHINLPATETITVKVQPDTRERKPPPPQQARAPLTPDFCESVTDEATSDFSNPEGICRA